MFSKFKFSGENFKIYIIILLTSIFVLFLGINTYESAKNRLIELSNQNKVIISQNLIGSFQNWFDERIASLNKASKFIEHSNIFSNKDEVAKFLKMFSENSAEFDKVQYLTNDGEIWVNGSQIFIKEGEVPLLGLLWYVQTKQSKSPTVTFMPKHYVLGQETLNFCVPNFSQNEFVAVLCGVVKVQSIFDKIKDFKLPSNSYSFIITNGGHILTPMSDKTLKSQIEEKLKEIILTNDKQRTINLGSNFIAISEIKFLNWFVGAGTDNLKQTSELSSEIGKNAFYLLLGFLLFASVANLLHNIAYANINASKKEYEMLLTHKAKMSEVGELVSGINHQFIQPVNSLKLIISSLLMMRKNDELDTQKLDKMLYNADKSVLLLSDTIEIFRNFYKASENRVNFSIHQSIKNILTLMHTELSRANVSVNLGNFNDRQVYQIENVIQQILLILLHNAKDAVVEKFGDDFKQRVINIDVKFDENMCYVLVSEFGGGVNLRMRDKIFSMPKTTKVAGNGIGLYFAKKLANEKLGGDLILKNAVNPTIFELKFAINLKEADV